VAQLEISSFYYDEQRANVLVTQRTAEQTVGNCNQ